VTCTDVAAMGMAASNQSQRDEPWLWLPLATQGPLKDEPWQQTATAILGLLQGRKNSCNVHNDCDLSASTSTSVKSRPPRKQSTEAGQAGVSIKARGRGFRWVYQGACGSCGHRGLHIG
jgi:hypothetical protein